MSRKIEFDELITPDGFTYELDDGVKRFLITAVTGQGLPPVEYITQRGPYQDGETVKGYRFGPRVLQMVHRRNGADRYQYWEMRADLLNYVRPNRGEDEGFNHHVLRKILPDGSKRDLDVRIESGPEFGVGQPDAWDEFSIQEALRFIASDPTFYDPITVTNVVSAVPGVELKYPAIYPLIYGPGGRLDTTLTVNYAGTYKAYPVIALLGPISEPTITNLTTGESITLLYNIPAGVTITIDLRYGDKTVIDSNNISRGGTVSEDSDIGTFHIAPASMAAPGGVNSIQFQAVNLDTGASITFSYNTRYLGI